MSSRDIIFSAAGVGGGDVNYIEDVFSTWLYTGNGTTQTITNGIDLAGEGGLVWAKSRSSGVFSHALYDTARGVNQWLASDSTGAQATLSGVSAFNSNGFSLGSANPSNAGSETFCSWTFREQAKFFDVVTFTNSSDTNQTISHSLGSTPGMIIIKCLNANSNWYVYHRSTPTKNIFLNTTGATQDPAVVDEANSTTFRFLGANWGLSGSGGTNFVAYLFAHDAGGFGTSGTDNVISCGSWTAGGSGSSVPPVTVTLGYEPQWLFVKRTDGANAAYAEWRIIDNMRTWTASNSVELYPNSSQQESGVSTNFSITSTGFVANLPGTVSFPGAGASYIYMAIRRPMKVPTLGTQVFTPVQNSNFTNGVVIAGQPRVDMSWSKQKDDTNAMRIFDRLRGSSTSTNLTLVPSSTAAETNEPYWAMDQQNGVRITSTLGTFNYINYFFTRASGFFDEVCYTGTGSATTQAHNLGAVPELMIVKKRNASASWQVYTAPTGNTLKLILEENGPTEGGSTSWNSTTPTSSVFSLGTDTRVNGSGDTFVNYLFATLAGVSKVGSYTGTGSTQTINAGLPTGARFVLIKRTNSTGDWWVWDTARGMVTSTDPRLALNSTAAELNNDWVFTTTGGFQIVTTDATINASGGTYIYLAIA